MYYICPMSKELLEFDVVVYLVREEDTLQEERYRDMGISMPEEKSEKREEIVKYSFNATQIIEIRETHVEFKGEKMSAVCVMFIVGNSGPIETPPLLTSYEDFKTKLNEYNQKNS